MIYIYRKYFIMTKLYFIIMSLFVFNISIAQTKAIKITKLDSNKERIIKENKRIKLRTLNKKLVKGRFKVMDDQTIMIEDINIKLSDIKELKRDPLITSILTTGILIYAGAATAGVSVIAGIFADSAAFWFILPAAGLIYVGIRSPNFNKNYKINKGWIYEVISIPK